MSPVPQCVFSLLLLSIVVLWSIRKWQRQRQQEKERNIGRQLPDDTTHIRPPR
jgi:membrane protein implicated in regulation of membrane protease activity